MSLANAPHLPPVPATPGRSPYKRHKNLQFQFTPPGWELEKQRVDERDDLMTDLCGRLALPDNAFYMNTARRTSNSVDMSSLEALRLNIARWSKQSASLRSS